MIICLFCIEESISYISSPHLFSFSPIRQLFTFQAFSLQFYPPSHFRVLASSSSKLSLFLYFIIVCHLLCSPVFEFATNSPTQHKKDSVVKISSICCRSDQFGSQFLTSTFHLVRVLYLVFSFFTSAAPRFSSFISLLPISSWQSNCSFPSFCLCRQTGSSFLCTAFLPFALSIINYHTRAVFTAISIRPSLPRINNALHNSPFSCFYGIAKSERKWCAFFVDFLPSVFLLQLLASLFPVSFVLTRLSQLDFLSSEIFLLFFFFFFPSSFALCDSLTCTLVINRICSSVCNLISQIIASSLYASTYQSVTYLISVGLFSAKIMPAIASGISRLVSNLREGAKGQIEQSQILAAATIACICRISSTHYPGNLHDRWSSHLQGNRRSQ